MTWSIDARIPVLLGTIAEAEPGDVLLLEGDVLPEGRAGECFGLAQHPAGCACCVTQDEVGAALQRLFLRRARGELPFFRRVVAVTASAAGDVALWTALRNDPVASARFQPLER